MGAAERIAELMKAMQDREIGEVLDFAEFLIAKREKELAVLAARPVISTQVVNEYLNVLLTKRKLARTDANELARALMCSAPGRIMRQSVTGCQ